MYLGENNRKIVLSKLESEWTVENKRDNLEKPKNNDAKERNGKEKKRRKRQEEQNQTTFFSNVESEWTSSQS